MRSVIRIGDLSVEEIAALNATASDIIDHPKQYAEVCHGKKLATLFFEPSTRTRLSFEAAMYDLGGACCLSPTAIPAPPPRARASRTRPRP